MTIDRRRSRPVERRHYVSTYVYMKILESAPRRYDLGLRIFSLGCITAVYEAVAASTVAGLTGRFTGHAAAGWSAATLAVVGLLTFDYAGSSPTAPAGLFEEKNLRVVLDVDRCTGAYNCWAVCPEAGFEKQPAIHKVSIARPEHCIRCGACLVQCPQDALAFEGPEGRRIGPEVVRRFKLNMLGKRAVPGDAATTGSTCG